MYTECAAAAGATACLHNVLFVLRCVALRSLRSLRLLSASGIDVAFAVAVRLLSQPALHVCVALAVASALATLSNFG